MRTTLNIDDPLYQKAKVRAASEGKTVTRVIQDALREFLSRPRKPKTGYRLRWTTCKGPVRPGVNPDDRVSLYDVMDDRV